MDKSFVGRLGNELLSSAVFATIVEARRLVDRGRSARTNVRSRASGAN
jgi:hypothetical protein